MDFEGLPEGCIADILSRTTPADACRLSLVSKLFHSAAESDALWERFLPSDYRSIISQCMFPDYPSKKALYLALSDRPVIIDEGKKVIVFGSNLLCCFGLSINCPICGMQSFQLERKSGKKIYMLAARSFSIVWGDTDQYWNWSPHPDSRSTLSFFTVIGVRLQLVHLHYYES